MSEKQTEGLADCEKVKNEWRKLALSFDSRRMQAVWHLTAMVDNPRIAKQAAVEFLKSAPSSNVSLSLEALKEDHIQRVMKLVKAYGDMIVLKGRSSFECENEAYRAIEEALRNPTL